MQNNRKPVEPLHPSASCPPDSAPGSCLIITSQAYSCPSPTLSLTGREVLTPFPSTGTSASLAQSGAHLRQCDLLKLSRRQKQLCRREPGLAETLQDAAHLGLLECQFQFRHERWNCSLEGRTGLLKRGGKRVGRTVLGWKVLGRRVGKEYLEEGLGGARFYGGQPGGQGPG